MRKPEWIRLDTILLPWERGLILETIAIAEGNQLELGELLDRTGIPLELTQYHLDFFVRVGMFEEQIVEGQKIYRMNMEKKIVRLTKDLFDAWYHRWGNVQSDPAI